MGPISAYVASLRPAAPKMTPGPVESVPQYMAGAKPAAPMRIVSFQPQPPTVATTVSRIRAAMNGEPQTTLQTMRASGGLNIPTTWKNYLPLIMIFALVVFIIFKK